MSRARIALVLFGALALASAPGAVEGEDADAPGLNTSRIRARVEAADGSPVVGATVIAYHLSTEQVFRSSPTDSRGRCEISAVPYGYFDLGVEAPDGLFVGNQVVNIVPGGKAALSFTLIEEESDRPFAGSPDPPSGLAQMLEKKRPFLASGKGIAVLATSATLVVVGLSGGGGNGSGDKAAVDDMSSASAPGQ